MKFLEKQSPSRIIAAGFLAVILGVVDSNAALSRPAGGGFTVRLTPVYFHQRGLRDGPDRRGCGRYLYSLWTGGGGGLNPDRRFGRYFRRRGHDLALGRKVNLKERLLVKEAMNVDTKGQGHGQPGEKRAEGNPCFEVAGAILGFICFSKRYDPLKALGVSVFHSIAAFNNSGFDNMGNFQNLIPYKDDVLLNMTTCGLIIFGGLGFLVIVDILKKAFLQEAGVSFQGGHCDDDCAADLRNSSDPADGGHYPDGRVLYQRIRQNGRIFHLLWAILQTPDCWRWRC